MKATEIQDADEQQHSPLPNEIATTSPRTDVLAQQLLPKLPVFVIKATVIASLGGVLFGYDMGVISGALPQLASTFSLTQREQEMTVSFLYLGGGIGAAVGGTLCDLSGRRWGILFTDIVFVAGAVLLYVAGDLVAVLWGRIIVGFAVAVSGVADVAYLHEISPVEWRGSIVSVNEAGIALGFLLAYVSGYGLSAINPDEGWRLMFALSGFVAIVQFAGMWFMPESPVWLRKKGYAEDADQVLRIVGGFDIGIRGGTTRQSTAHEIQGGVHNSRSDAEDNWFPEGLPTKRLSVKEVTDTSSSRQTQNLTSVSQHSSAGSHSSVIPEKIEQSHYRPQGISLYICFHRMHSMYGKFACVITTYRRQVLIALFLATTSQLCGQANVLNYAPLIFTQIGLVSSKSSLASVVLLGIIKFTVTILVIWRIEFLGRRYLLLGGIGIMALSLIMLAIAFTGVGEDGMDKVSVYLALPGVMGVVVGYSASFGPLNWLLTSELFPTEIRGRALGGSTIVTYLCASLVSYTFLSVQDAFGQNTPFVIYAAITSFGLVFAYLAIPNTGGKDAEEIEIALDNMQWWANKKKQNEGNEITNLPSIQEYMPPQLGKSLEITS